MDFKELLDVADYNKAEAKSEASIKRYSTVLAPPRKLPKAGVKSDGIKRFLEKKKAEEQRLVAEARKKKEELLAIRAQSTKNSKKAKIMASRTKDNDFSRIRLTEDEVEAKKKREAELVRQNLANKVERMKARIEMEEKEKLLPRKRKRKSKHNESNEVEMEPSTERHSPDTYRDSKFDESKHGGKYGAKNNKAIHRNPRPVAPPMSFHDLLKVAAKKQYEPIDIPVKKKEEERPMTKKERRLMLEEQARAKRKQELLDRGVLPTTRVKSSDLTQHRTVATPAKRDSVTANEQTKTNNVKKPVVVHVKQSSKPISESTKLKNLKSNDSSGKSSSSKSFERETSGHKTSSLSQTGNLKQNSSKMQRNNSNHDIRETDFKKDAMPKKNGIKINPVVRSEKSAAPSRMLDEDAIAAIEKRIREKIEKEMEERLMAKFNLGSKKPSEEPPGPVKRKAYENVRDPDFNKSSKAQTAQNKSQPKMENRTLGIKKDVQRTQIAKRDALLSQKQASQKARHPPERKPKPFHPNPYLDPPQRLLVSQRPAKFPIKRIESDDDDDDDDDDMSDFIDNTPSQNEEDYSKYIEEIFGYDKTRYRHLDDQEVMETSFAEQMKEEVRSAKLGYLEDLEEERKEREELRRKKKKLKK